MLGVLFVFLYPKRKGPQCFSDHIIMKLFQYLHIKQAHAHVIPVHQLANHTIGLTGFGLTTEIYKSFFNKMYFTIPPAPFSINGGKRNAVIII